MLVGSKFFLKLRVLRFEGCHLPSLELPQVHWNLRAHGGRERAEQRIVVAHRNGIILVIVAAGTADRRRQHRTPRRGQHVIQCVVADTFRLGDRDLRGKDSSSQEPGRHQCARVVRCKLVSCNLPPDELVVGHVFVECPDHEIPIVVGKGPVGVVLKSVALGEARHIEPMPRPTFPEMVALQQLVDHLFVTIIIVVRHKRLHRFARGRQPEQIKPHTSKQLCWLQQCRRLQSVRCVLGGNETVDGIR